MLRSCVSSRHRLPRVNHSPSIATRETVGPSQLRLPSSNIPVRASRRILFVAFRIQQLFHLVHTTRFVICSSHISSPWRPSSKSSCRACWTASTPCDSSTSVSIRDVPFSRLSWSRPNHRLVQHTLLDNSLPLLLLFCDEQPLALDLQLFAALTDNTP